MTLYVLWAWLFFPNGLGFFSQLLAFIKTQFRLMNLLCEDKGQKGLCLCISLRMELFF